MRARGWGILAVVVAIAACSDVSSPTEVATVPVAGPEAHFLGGHSFDDHYGAKKSGHDRDGDDACRDDDGAKHLKSFHKSGKGGRYARHWSRRWHDFRRHWKKHGHQDGDRDEGDCDSGGGGGDGGGDGGGTGPGTVQGLVQNNGLAADAYPVYLLSADGATVVATVTTDATGAFSFTGVAPGAYLVCEANPFVLEYGFLAQTTPSGGPACPAAYGPAGYMVTVTAGGTSVGSTFLNFGLV
jgi:hypothetical protein